MGTGKGAGEGNEGVAEPETLLITTGLFAFLLQCSSAGCLEPIKRETDYRIVVGPP